MKVKKNINKRLKVKYPYKIYLDNGRVVPVPSQHKFSDNYINKHGCSLVAFYMGIRFLGVKKNLIWCKKYLDKNYGLHGHAKYNLSQINGALNKIVSGKRSKFYKEISEKTLRKVLKEGNLVLFEEKSPIHTAVLLWNGKNVLRFSDGSYKKVPIDSELDKRCKDSYYGGCIVIKSK